MAWRSIDFGIPSKSSAELQAKRLKKEGEKVLLRKGKTGLYNICIWVEKKKRGKK